MITVALGELRAGMRISGALVVLVDVQPVWVKIYFDNGNVLTVRNSPQSSVAVGEAECLRVNRLTTGA